MIATVLKGVDPSTQFFVFNEEITTTFLRDEFDWSPTVMKDARKLSESVPEVQPTIASMAKYLTGGAHCRVGRNYAIFSTPSPNAVHHRDVDVSIVFRFCMRVLGLNHADKVDAEREARKKERQEKRKREDDSLPRSRKR